MLHGTFQTVSSVDIGHVLRGGPERDIKIEVSWIGFRIQLLRTNNSDGHSEYCQFVPKSREDEMHEFLWYVWGYLSDENCYLREVDWFDTDVD